MAVTDPPTDRVATLAVAEPRPPRAPRAIAAVLPPLILSLSLILAVALFMLASYPLWPRMYLSPVLDLFPSLAKVLLDAYSTDFAHEAVEATRGDIFFYSYVFAMAALFGTYLGALRYAHRVRPRESHLRWVIATTALAGLLLLFAPTLFTSDLYSYIIYGRMAAAYGANPLATAPSQYPFDPVFPLVYWKDAVSVYGPVWVALSQGLMSLVPPVVSEQVVAFKALAVLFHLGNTIVIWHIMLGLSPRRRLFGAVSYAWNPLLLVEFAANGHNDVAMLFFMLLALLAAVRGHRTLPLVCLLAAVLTKWVAVFAVPIYLVALLREEPSWRARFSYLVRNGALALGLATAFYFPYWSGPASFTTMFATAPVERFINSPAEVMVPPFAWLIRTWLPDLPQFVPVLVLKLMLALGFLAVWIRELRRSSAASRIAGSWLRTLFAYLVFGSVWFWPWYVAWVVPFAAIRGWCRMTYATFLFTLSGALFYSTWPGAPLRPFEPFYEWRAAFLFGLPLGYLALSLALGLLRPSRARIPSVLSDHLQRFRPIRVLRRQRSA